MAAIIRLKRKASDEPAEGLVIALKKPKCEKFDGNEVLFKFAATLKSEKESVRDHIHAALSKEKDAKFSKWRNPKANPASASTVKKVCDKIKTECKKANAKKKLDLLNNRRLILTDEFPDIEDSEDIKDAEVRQLFHLYDIIEENEDIKKQIEDMGGCTITCNDTPLIREKIGDYVYDVYIADGHIDRTFIDEAVSVRPCSWTVEDIYSGDSGSSEECYEDEDDSNDENNWRNDYPEDEDSDKESEDASDDDDREVVHSYDDVSRAFNHFDLADDEYDGSDSETDNNFHDYSSRVLKELKEEYEDN